MRFLTSLSFCLSMGATALMAPTDHSTPLTEFKGANIRFAARNAQVRSYVYSLEFLASGEMKSSACGEMKSSACGFFQADADRFAAELQEERETLTVDDVFKRIETFTNSFVGQNVLNFFDINITNLQSPVTLISLRTHSVSLQSGDPSISPTTLDHAFSLWELPNVKELEIRIPHHCHTLPWFEGAELLQWGEVLEQKGEASMLEGSPLSLPQAYVDDTLASNRDLHIPALMYAGNHMGWKELMDLGGSKSRILFSNAPRDTYFPVGYFSEGQNPLKIQNVQPWHVEKSTTAPKAQIQKDTPSPAGGEADIDTQTPQAGKSKIDFRSDLEDLDERPEDATKPVRPKQKRITKPTPHPAYKALSAWQKAQCLMTFPPASNHWVHMLREEPKLAHLIPMIFKPTGSTIVYDIQEDGVDLLHIPDLSPRLWTLCSGDCEPVDVMGPRMKTFILTSPETYKLSTAVTIHRLGAMPRTARMQIDFKPCWQEGQTPEQDEPKIMSATLELSEAQDAGQKVLNSVGPLYFQHPGDTFGFAEKCGLEQEYPDFIDLAQRILPYMALKEWQDQALSHFFQGDLAKKEVKNP
jgi:hypothetical protein